MDQSQLKWIADFIWNIADDRLRDVYVRGKYRDVILPILRHQNMSTSAGPRTTETPARLACRGAK
jgi:type I restriction-modification system DNA methylase subunit